MSLKPFVSIVVPVYNEEYTLAETISALQAQEYGGRFEIIIVNNACTDRSPQIAAALGCRVVDQPIKGYVHALIAGFNAAQGEMIACTDADTIVPPNWLTRMVTTVFKHDAVACSGVFRFCDGPAWLRILGAIFGRLNWHLAGANMIVRTEAYRAVGGFRTNVNMGADVELGMRLQKIGRLIVDRDIVVDTSARRFTMAFWQTLWLYYVNDLSLLLLRKPFFYNFPAFRIPREAIAYHRPILQFGFVLVLLCSFLFVSEQPGSQLLGTVLAQGNKNRQVVALTFDDGPGPSTGAVLNILARYNVKATFFVIGRNVERYPEIARRIVAEGHCIGNHTYSHPLLAPVESPRKIRDELDRTRYIIAATTGVTTDLFRPPHGWRSPWMLQLAQKSGYTVVTWTAEAFDWRHPSPRMICDRVVSHVNPGAIVLLHDGINGVLNMRMDCTV
ncbi:MAG: polysaccharide deacetylase family protein, partial [Chitinivibrionales bacterium]|nr:polysaccharide deacetylase family protein [Chitinivibrionales bacterium]